MSTKPKDGDRIHEVGDCPDTAYGRDCDGIGTWGPDPFAEDVDNDPTPRFQCEGERTGSAMDI